MGHLSGREEGEGELGSVLVAVGVSGVVEEIREGLKEEEEGVVFNGIRGELRIGK